MTDLMRIVFTERELEELDNMGNEVDPPDPGIPQDAEAQPPLAVLPPFFPLLTDIKFCLNHRYFLDTATYVLPTILILAITSYLYSPQGLFRNCNYEPLENPGPFMNCIFASLTGNFSSSNPIFTFSTTFLIIGITALGLIVSSLCMVHALLVDNLWTARNENLNRLLTATQVGLGISVLMTTGIFLWIGRMPAEDVVTGVIGSLVYSVVRGLYKAFKERFRRYRMRPVQV
ncbi:hypothetical protein TWF730_002245 [Orbilia blumenaviensis]|uniref:Uncharacterized protein n=1 Tax=Orbilia blumenaviensis TaxID=1796055 RepID=A0AAV9UDU2_9PEZI